jgi:hypothetical protein
MARVSWFEKARNCQRNWDLTKPINSDLKEELIEIALNSPIKQNIEHYELCVVEDRTIIKDIFDFTARFPPPTNFEIMKTRFPGHTDEEYDEMYHWLARNSQVLAPLLFVWVSKPEITQRSDEKNLYNWRWNAGMAKNTDINMSIGVSSGAVMTYALSKGLHTGFCACLIRQYVMAEMLGYPVGYSAEVILGIGYPKDGQVYGQHHVYPEYEYEHYRRVPVELKRL